MKMIFKIQDTAMIIAVPTFIISFISLLICTMNMPPESNIGPYKPYFQRMAETSPDAMMALTLVGSIFVICVITVWTINFLEARGYVHN
jgi:hypothetical protein